MGNLLQFAAHRNESQDRVVPASEMFTELKEGREYRAVDFTSDTKRSIPSMRTPYIQRDVAMVKR